MFETAESRDTFLEFVLAKNSREDYERFLVSYGTGYGVDPAEAIKVGEKWLRRRAKCRSLYTGPGDEKSRSKRCGLPYSYVEDKVLNWAKDWHNEGRVEPTSAYLANLLQRTVEEVEQEISKRQNTKHGILGFDLESSE